ncbi:acyl-CoA carboxylase epsilon subunit [Streptomyces palmae]|uniref:Acyl-CoA carboxylase subunit epsilon n=1 Tax=Streptomyces palmae TaxID=1701085 RepID=A0A4Z0G8C2_9ACTN|nr:acyl-CoA carboxylase epsilon subunit [Streptomyces palmae]TGA92538.1 acyl-CoA carboxylase subunit epsilon [Streptomyces palmae]
MSAAADPAEGGPVIDGPLAPALVKVIRGNPGPDELAAATAVLLAVARRAEQAAGAADQESARTPRWQPSLADGCPPRSWRSGERTG